jgi:hypothetical protein
VRQRYNAKARQSTLGGSSHKKRRRSTTKQEEVEDEQPEVSVTEHAGEMDMILPGQREQERERRMQVSQCDSQGLLNHAQRLPVTVTGDARGADQQR